MRFASRVRDKEILSCKEVRVGNWGDSWVGKVTAMSARGPDLNPRTYVQKSGLVLRDSQSTVKGKTGRSVGAHWLVGEFQAK